MTFNSQTDMELAFELRYWMDEYERCFGERPHLFQGIPTAEVHLVQSKILRHYIEKMKEVLASNSPT